MTRDDRHPARLSGIAKIADLAKFVGFALSFGLSACSSSDDTAPDSPWRADRVSPAAFEVDADSLERGEPISFEAVQTRGSNRDDRVYSWDFGDGTRGSGPKIAHIYTDEGEVSVTLTVYEDGNRVDSATETILVGAPRTTKATSEVTVHVTDPEGRDLEGVEVRPVGSDRKKTTGARGRATFDEMPTGAPLVFEAEKPGYARQIVRRSLPDESETATITLRLDTVDRVVRVEEIRAGAEIDLSDGSRLEFPPRSVVDRDGDLVEGPIRIAFSSWDPSGPPDEGVFPGSRRGLRRDGTLQSLANYGAVTVELRREGEPVRVAPGSRVKLEIPVYSAGLPSDATLPLWSLDRTTGIWVEEGRANATEDDASPTGRILRAEVTHFSDWTGAYPVTTPCRMKPTCMITDIQQGPDEAQYGEADIPLKEGQTCDIRVTAKRAPGLGSDCSISNLESSIAGESCSDDSDCKVCQDVQGALHRDPTGDACNSSSDCRYVVEHHDEPCGPDGNQTCHVEDEYDTGTCAAPGRISCDTSSLPPPANQSQPGPGGNCNTGVCESPYDDHEGVQYCDSGSCSLPANGGVYEGADEQFSRTFTVDHEGEVDPDSADNPESTDGWIWVPNKDLKISGVTRKGTLHGATNAYGHEGANEEFTGGSAVTCRESEPVIPLRHECEDGREGLTGNCPTVKRRHFCDLLFKCPESEFARTFTQDLGIPSEEACVQKLENDFDLDRLEHAYDQGRIDYDGERAEVCLDMVAAIRQEVNEAIEQRDMEERRRDCAEFDAQAFDINACTGVVGSVAKGDDCVHDLECTDEFDADGRKTENRSCKRYGEDDSGPCFGRCVKDVSAERNCEGGGSCDAGEYCDSNTCVPKKDSVGAPCDGAGQCTIGLYCDLDAANSTCKERNFHLEPGNDAASASKCSDRADVCRMGSVCTVNPDSGDTSQQLCMPFADPRSSTPDSCLGETAGGQARCRWDSFCSDGTCVTRNSDGESCDRDYECLSGLCLDDGTCFGPGRGRSCPN